MILIQLILLPFHFLLRIVARTFLLIITLAAALILPILALCALIGLEDGWKLIELEGRWKDLIPASPENLGLIAVLSALGILGAVVGKTWKAILSSLAKIGTEVWELFAKGWMPNPILGFRASLSTTWSDNIAQIYPKAKKVFLSSGGLIASLLLMLLLVWLAHLSIEGEKQRIKEVDSLLQETPPHVVVVTSEDRITSYLLQKGTIFSLLFISNGSFETGEGICLTEDQKIWLAEFKKAINKCAEFSDPPSRLQVTVRAYASIAPVKMEGGSSLDNAPSSDDLNCEIGNRRAEEVVNFLIHDEQKDPAGFACKSVGASGDPDYRGSGECQRSKKRFEFGPDEDLDFNLIYLPWPTHKEMVASKPADDGDSELGPRRYAVEFLNRSVHLALETDACKVETEKDPPR